jgi:hypothetical protein
LPKPKYPIGRLREACIGVLPAAFPLTTEALYCVALFIFSIYIGLPLDGSNRYLRFLCLATDGLPDLRRDRTPDPSPQGSAPSHPTSSPADKNGIGQLCVPDVYERTLDRPAVLPQPQVSDPVHVLRDKLYKICTYTLICCE